VILLAKTKWIPVTQIANQNKVSILYANEYNRTILGVSTVLLDIQMTFMQPTDKLDFSTEVKATLSQQLQGST